MTIKLKSIFKATLTGIILLAPFSGNPVLGESLWTKKNNRERSMFADRKASQAGDILTVIIDESSTMANTQRTTTSKKSSIANEINQFLFSPSASGFGTHNGELPKTNITGDNSYEGGGNISNRQSFSGRASLTVIDKLPNGNLVLEGIRVVSFSGETHYMVLHGIVRPEDITPGNTVFSSAIADARIETVTEGSLTVTQKKGWLNKINDLINPF